MSIFIVLIFIGACFYFLKKNNQSEFVDTPTTPISYSYPKIYDLDDLENAFKYLSAEKIPYNIQNLEEYVIRFQNL